MNASSNDFDYDDPEYLRMRAVALPELVKEPETVAEQYEALLAALSDEERHTAEETVTQLQNDGGMGETEARAELLARYVARFLQQQKQNAAPVRVPLRPMALPNRPAKRGKKRR